MTQRRMISLQITDTDAFLDMPATSQLLYFHLTIRADDEGFVDNPKKISRLIGVQNDDLKVLIAKRFVLDFNSGVVVIKHWLIHNTIRMDRFNKTVYQDEKNSLIVKENKAYTEIENTRQPNGNQLAPQVKLSKDKISKVKLSKSNLSSKDDDWNFKKELLKLLNDKQKHIRIIGLFVKAKKYTPANHAELQAIIKRNLKVANRLKVYTFERITEVLKYLVEQADFKYTLESVEKFIDEDLTTLNKNDILIIK